MKNGQVLENSKELIHILSANEAFVLVDQSDPDFNSVSNLVVGHDYMIVSNKLFPHVSGLLKEGLPPIDFKNVPVISNSHMPSSIFGEICFSSFGNHWIHKNFLDCSFGNIGLNRDSILFYDFDFKGSDNVDPIAIVRYEDVIPFLERYYEVQDQEALISFLVNISE